MMSESRSRAEACFHLLAGLSIVGAIGYGIFVQIHSNGLQKEIRDAEADILRFEQTQAETEALEFRVIELRESVNTYQRAFPEDRESSSIVQEVHDAASFVGVEVLSAEFALALVSRGLQKRVYRLCIGGTLSELIGFASRMERHPFPRRLTYLDIESNDADLRWLEASFEFHVLEFTDQEKAPRVAIADYERKRNVVRAQIALDSMAVPSSPVSVDEVFVPDVFCDPRSPALHEVRELEGVLSRDR